MTRGNLLKTLGSVAVVLGILGVLVSKSSMPGSALVGTTVIWPGQTKSFILHSPYDHIEGIADKQYLAGDGWRCLMADGPKQSSANFMKGGWTISVIYYPSIHDSLTKVRVARAWWAIF